MFGIEIVHFIVYYGISLIILAMLIRAIASWFGMDERFAFIRFLARITDPLIEPVRRIVPPVGVMDISFLIVFFLLWVARQLIFQALPVGW